MFNDLFEIVREFIKKVFSSRLFAAAVVFTGMFSFLVLHLFDLQIIHGEEYLKEYMQKTEKEVSLPGTRGNIYDCNGNLLAYNELTYSVTVQDTGDYPKQADKNAMFLRLVTILKERGETVQGKFQVTFDSNGEMVYSTTSETARRRFLADVYGLRLTDDLDKDGKNPSNITARELFEQKKEDYELHELKDELGNAILIPDDLALDIINIRYTMGLTAYRKYESTTVATEVSEETVVEIQENLADLRGVDIEETSVRKYNNSIYFSPIIGYTGKMQKEQLEELQAENADYDINDIVGISGIEAAMETTLQGKKGYRRMYVNNVGRIMEVVEETEAVAGNDVYLSIDQDLQMATYRLIEQQLAGIITSNLVNRDVEITVGMDMSKKPIPVKDAYFQLINNNVLSLKEMMEEDASAIEQEIYRAYQQEKEQVLMKIENELQSANAAQMKDLPADMMAYMVYIYEYLSSSTVQIIQKDKIDTSSEEYQAWKNDTISLRDYIYYGIANNWIDTTSEKLELSSRYSSADDIYNHLTSYILESLDTDTQFTKKIYRYMINDGKVTGRQLCLALYEQEVLPWDEEEVRALSGNGENYAYTFLKEKISNLEITPAQLALDPCTGSCVVIDVRTGKAKAIVSYPSYDNNLFSGSINAAYYRQLNEDMSYPLRNHATSDSKAPGSTFKPITAVAALTEGVIQLGETVNCTGIYEEISNPIKCWIHPGKHGPLDVIGGIENSCNVFVSEMAHRMSIDENGNYAPETGLETLRKYASMFGLDRVSGIEIGEFEPEISDTDPERSSMGQGTNRYANIQLARYVTALANKGTVYDLTLLDKVTDSDGNLLERKEAIVSQSLDEIADSTWTAVHQGMRNVVSLSSTKNVFRDLPVEIAGKTGTAQEDRTRANHAWFVSFAPYSSPEICVTVNIPNGYSSSNAAMIAKNVYKYYYGYTDLEQIMNTGALDAANVTINGD